MGHAAVAAKAMAWGHAVVGDGTRRRSGAGSGETWGWGDTFQESEPSWYRTPLEAHAREAILWHRRETRRQTENTNRLLRGGQTATEKRGEQRRAEGRGVGRERREVENDATGANQTFTSAL
jgi:hypothetical protein